MPYNLNFSLTKVEICFQRGRNSLKIFYSTEKIDCIGVILKIELLVISWKGSSRCRLLSIPETLKLSKLLFKNSMQSLSALCHMP